MTAFIADAARPTRYERVVLYAAARLERYVSARLQRRAIPTADTRVAVALYVDCQRRDARAAGGLGVLPR
ncbi:hypothetical protein [Microbacterium sp. NPDC076911]|uniref:hypothetical protein n=1 Tax=Microbacterium sp. NPDC076911 TaxID=3154958 RepID=UPI0034336D18